jgi:hypothetical protein
MIGSDATAVVIQHRYIGILGNLPGLRTGWIVNGQNRFLDALLVGECFQFVGEIFIVVQEDNKAAQAGFFILDGSGVNLLDQTGQGVTDLASEDHGDRISTVSSDEALFLTGEGAGHILRMEGAYAFPHLQAGFQGLIGTNTSHGQ